MTFVLAKTAMRGAIWGAVALGTGGAVLGCGTDLGAWRARLASRDVQRLLGTWEISLRADSSTSLRTPVPVVVGQVALTLNEEHLATSDFGEPPMFFGTYNIDLGRLGFGSAYNGFPRVVGRIRRDSVDLNIAAESKLPIELRGVVAGDSVLGRWNVHSRAGPDGAGVFILRRQ